MRLILPDPTPAGRAVQLFLAVVELALRDLRQAEVDLSVPFAYPRQDDGLYAHTSDNALADVRRAQVSLRYFADVLAVAHGVAAPRSLVASLEARQPRRIEAGDFTDLTPELSGKVKAMQRRDWHARKACVWMTAGVDCLNLHLDHLDHASRLASLAAQTAVFAVESLESLISGSVFTSEFTGGDIDGLLYAYVDTFAPAPESCCRALPAPVWAS